MIVSDSIRKEVGNSERWESFRKWWLLEEPVLKE